MLPVIRGQCDKCNFSRNLYMNELKGNIECDHADLGCTGKIRRVWTGSKKKIPPYLVRAYHTCLCQTSLLNSFPVRDVSKTLGGNDGRTHSQTDPLVMVGSVAQNEEKPQALQGKVEIRNEWRQWLWRHAVVTQNHRFQLFFSEHDDMPMVDVTLSGAKVVDKHYKAVGLVSLRSFGLKIELSNASICIALSNERELDLWRCVLKSAAAGQVMPPEYRPEYLSEAPFVRNSKSDGFALEPRPWCYVCHSVFSSSRLSHECHNCQKPVCLACSSTPPAIPATVSSSISDEPLDSPSSSLKHQTARRVCKNCLPLSPEEHWPKKPDDLHSRMGEAYNSIPFTLRSFFGRDMDGAALSEEDWIAEGYGVLEVKVHEAIGLSGDDKSRPCVQVECQRAYGRTKARLDTLAPRWTDDPSFRFVLHEPLMELYVAVVDEDYEEIMGAAELKLHALRNGQSCHGWVLLEIPRESSDTQQYLDKTKLRDGLLTIDGVPLHRCYWGSSDFVRGAVKIEVSLKVKHCRREVLSCLIPPMLKSAESSATIRHDDPELLVTQVYEDAIAILDIVVLTGLANLVSFVSELLLWHTPEYSLIALLLSVATLLGMLLGISASSLLLCPLSIVAGIIVFFVVRETRGNSSAVGFTGFLSYSYFGGGDSKSPQNSMWNATILGVLLSIPAATGWLLHPLSIAAGITAFVVRKHSYYGKSENKSAQDSMWNFWGHYNGCKTSAEILVVKPAGAYSWSSIARGQAIPTNAVDTGSTMVDGSLRVGRYDGQAGKINLKGNAMSNFRAHGILFRTKDAEILLLAPNAKAKWVPISRGDFIPEGVVCVGRTEKDGPNYVGRYQGEAGKINTDYDRDNAEVATKLYNDSDEQAVADRVQVPARVRLLIKAFSGLGGDHVAFSSEQRKSTARLAMIVSRTRKMAVWLKRALGQDIGAGAADWGPAIMFMGAVWIIAFSLLIASLQFWIIVGLVCGTAMYSPWTRSGITVGLGFFRYVLRPSRMQPDDLLANVPNHCLSANYVKWARRKGFNLADVDIFGFVEHDNVQQLPQSVSVGNVTFTSCMETAKLMIATLAAVLHWCRGPGFEVLFFRSYHYYMWARAVLELSLQDIPILRQMSRDLLGKANHQVVTYRSPLERSVVNVVGAPFRAFGGQKTKTEHDSVPK